MSARMSKAMKILRDQRRREKKQAAEVNRLAAMREKHRKPGETDEQLEARMKRDLSGWLDMMDERDVEAAVLAAAEEAAHAGVEDRPSDAEVDRQLDEGSRSTGESDRAPEPADDRGGEGEETDLRNGSVD